MFQSLIETPATSQEIFSKIAHQLISKYQLQYINNLGDFSTDLDNVVQQMKLYNQSLEQLFTHKNISQLKLLLGNNQSTLKIIEFLGKMVKKVYLQLQQRSRSNGHKPLAVCNVCTHNIEHTNIKQLQRQILDRSPYPFQQLEQELKYSDTHAYYDERFATPEEVLMRKMASLQQNINERESNLIRCIDDFENIRADLLIGIKKREFDRQINSFDLKSYSLHLTKHFLGNFKKIQQKINLLKKQVHILQDKSIQTNLTQEGIVSKTQTNVSKLQQTKTDLDFRKLNDQKAKLEDNCKRYLIELKELSSKLQAYETQNKALRDELTTQKFKSIIKQKIVNRNVENEQKARKQQQLKRQSMLQLLNTQNALAGQFANAFLQNYLANCNKDEQEIMPIIKATFKRTFDSLMHQRMSLNIPHHDYKVPSKRRDSEEEQSRRRKSKKKSIRFPTQAQAKESRFAANKKATIIINALTISSQISYKITPIKQIAFYHTQQQAERNSLSGSKYMKSMGENVILKKKRNRYSKLNSMLSEYKENHNSTEQLLSAHKITRQIIQTQPNQPHISPKNKIVRKDTFNNRSHSKFFSEKDNVLQLAQLKPPIKIKKLLTVDSKAVRQFLFMRSQEEVKQGNGNRNSSDLCIDSLLHEANSKKNKIILNLQEINYLTQFFSILANLHITKPQVYTQIKSCIFAKVQKGELREFQSKHHLILKKSISQIVFKHRQCQKQQSLCPHLREFLKQIERQQ